MCERRALHKGCNPSVLEFLVGASMLAASRRRSRRRSTWLAMRWSAPALARQRPSTCLTFRTYLQNPVKAK